MEIDWNGHPAEYECSLNAKDIEESFEDPFAIRLLPDSSRFAAQARFFNLGKSASSVGVFSVYRTNGKQIEVICARPFTEEEQFFYQRRLNQSIGS